jgi:hypothetical protein
LPVGVFILSSSSVISIGNAVLHQLSCPLSFASSKGTAPVIIASWEKDELLVDVPALPNVSLTLVFSTDGREPFSE